MCKAFEIVYADGTLVAGSTAAEFAAAPDGIQFVIVRDSQGALQVLKGRSEYEFDGERKQGAWTDSENYNALKRSLMDKSNLLVNRGALLRIPRRRPSGS